MYINVSGFNPTWYVGGDCGDRPVNAASGYGSCALGKVKATRSLCIRHTLNDCKRLMCRLLVNTRHKKVGYLSATTGEYPSFFCLTKEQMMGSISVCRKPPHAKTFGVELECYPTPSYKNTEIFRDYNSGRVTHLGFWEITFDASLDYGGCEFVSQPMPYDMMVKQIKKIHQALGGWTVREECGLHIHVSRKMWSYRRRRQFDELLYYAANRQDFINWFGRMSRYANPADPDRLLDDKRRAINLLHPATYEFRVWKAGDLDWTLEAFRRTRAIVLHQGEYTRDWMNALCKIKDETKPASSLASTFQQAANIPAVRRIRRA